MLHYDNWTRPNAHELHLEWESEWDKMRHYLNTRYFDDEQHFIEACKSARFVRLTKKGDEDVERRSHCESIDEVEEMVSTYRTAARRKGVPTKLAEMMKAGEPLPAALLFKLGRYVYCVGGNTRLDVARILGVTPDPLVMLVDLNKLNLPLSAQPMNEMFRR